MKKFLLDFWLFLTGSIQASAPFPSEEREWQEYLDNEPLPALQGRPEPTAGHPAPTPVPKLV